jgi:hypothetical protein
VLALLIFHARVGVRIAARAFVPLFCAMLVAVMVQMYPAALVRGVARELFSTPPGASTLAAVAILSLLLPAWGVRRLAAGLGGWMRHLPLGDSRNRLGLELSLVVVQLPLLVSLGLLALVAHLNGLALFRPVLLRLVVLVLAGALAALPVRRAWLVLPVSVSAAVAAVLGPHWAAMSALPILVLAERLAGPIRAPRPSRRREFRLPFGAGIAWRALGWRTPLALAASAFPLLAAWLFATNNELRGSLESGTWRFGISLGIVTVISILSESLAVRRPVWPWLRSLPFSSLRRVTEDAVFLGLHSLPVLVLGALFHWQAALAASSVAPFIVLRASGSMRRLRLQPSSARTMVAEACLASALLALLPWSAAVWPVAAIAAFTSARRAELDQKVTRWLEVHHDAGGDSLSWSE